MKPILILVATIVFSISAAQAGDSCCKGKSCCDAKTTTAKKADTSVRGAQLLVKR